MSEFIKLHQDELYPEYKKLVINISRRFMRQLPDEHLDDLTQTCWEDIIRKYPTFVPDKAAYTTWVIMVSKHALYNLMRSINTDKRAIRNHLVSLDELTKYDSQKYL